MGRDLNAAPDDILLGAGANEARVARQAAGSICGAVFRHPRHAAGRTALPGPAGPGAVAARPPATSTAADGLLTASEIAGLKINANLVVLSACNTAAGGGKSFGGGALQGLADAFFDAGAHAVLASHWEVPSAATMSLMTGTFANMATDPAHDAAEALRQAQLSPDRARTTPPIPLNGPLSP